MLILFANLIQFDRDEEGCVLDPIGDWRRLNRRKSATHSSPTVAPNYRRVLLMSD